MQRKRQFHTTIQRRTFFDRKILHYGSSRAVALGKVIPKDWEYVRIGIIEKNPATIAITITRLKVTETHAQNTKTNKGNRQNP